VSAAGVTAGMMALCEWLHSCAAIKVAQEIQLHIQYAPEPPFNSGTPASAPPEILEAARSVSREITSSVDDCKTHCRKVRVVREERVIANNFLQSLGLRGLKRLADE